MTFYRFNAIADQLTEEEFERRKDVSDKRSLIYFEAFFIVSFYRINFLLKLIWRKWRKLSTTNDCKFKIYIY